MNLYDGELCRILSPWCDAETFCTLDSLFKVVYCPPHARDGLPQGLGCFPLKLEPWIPLE